MKIRIITHTAAVLLSGVTSLFSQDAASPLFFSKVKATKKSEAEGKAKLGASGPMVFAPSTNVSFSPSAAHQFPWKPNIVTTVFWIGEKPSANNPTPNKSSSWDANWAGNYGGFDNPDRSQRRNLIPVDFTPRQNPFYCALPYNDKARDGQSTRGGAGRTVVQGSISRPRRLDLQRPLDRDPSRESRSLRTMGRCRSVPHRSLAIRFRKRTAETEFESRCRP